MDTKRFEEVTRMTPEDFDNLVYIIADRADKQATPLFKHRKSNEELSEILCQMWWHEELHVFADADTKEWAGVIAFDTAELWWIDGIVLVEDMLVSLSKRPSGFGSFAVSYLEKEAKNRGCSLILSGSSMVQDSQIVQNMYKKHGFVVYGESYLKEL